MMTINDDDKSELLVAFATANSISVDDVLGLYVLLGDDLFFLFSVFQGKVLRFPFKRKLSTFGKSEILKLIECKEDTSEQDLIERDGVRYIVKNIRTILGHRYAALEVEQ